MNVFKNPFHSNPNPSNACNGLHKGMAGMAQRLSVCVPRRKSFRVLGQSQAAGIVFLPLNQLNVVHLFGVGSYSFVCACFSLDLLQGVRSP